MARNKSNPEGQLSLPFASGSSAKNKAKKKKSPGSTKAKKTAVERTVGATKERPQAKKTAGAQKAKKAGRKTAGKTVSKATGKKVNKPAKRSAGRTVRRTVEHTVEHIKDEHIEAKAQAMASQQREISISEFFAKNRHLLGFDNPRKALLTAVKEAVDNSLDACEEGHILPDIEIGIRQTGEDRFLIWVEDNGPGIVKNQIPHIFGRLLYGSKFHTLRMARGQQGIGISAAGMYGLLTTGKNIKINSKTGPRSQAHHYELRIDTKKNRPDIIKDEVIDWPVRSGTRVEIEMEARYQKGRQSVDEYLAQTAITNPHTHIRYVLPDGEVRQYDRSVKQVVTVPKAVKPHPYGIEMGVLMKMAKDSSHNTVAAFLCNEFSRVTSRVSQQILEKAKLTARSRTSRMSHGDIEKLHRAINETKIMAPSTNCVVPIGEEALQAGLARVVDADFYKVCTRPPSVYRGNPFQIEVGVAYGGSGYNGNNGSGGQNGKSDNNGGPELMRVLRFANRVPLLYQQSACAIFKSIMQTNWRLYGLSQSRGALPAGSVTAIVHMASVWVPFTSESKEAVAHYPEIIKEIKLALSECGRALGRYMRGQKRRREEVLKRSYIEKYLPAIGEALRDILSLKEKQVTRVVANLENVLEQSRK